MGRATKDSDNQGIGYENFCDNINTLIKAIKIWRRIMPVCQNFKAYNTWLAKGLSNCSNPFHLSAHD